MSPRTLVQLHPPLIVALLHRVRHLSRFGGMKEASYKRNSGHRTAQSDSWSGSGNGKRRWSCALEGGVAESVECADEVGKRWNTHGEIYSEVWWREVRLM